VPRGLRSSVPPFRYRPNVGIVLIGPDRHVFVGQRKGIAAAAWQMPQGGIDAGEEPRSAALRELEEEVGTCKVEVLRETTDWLTYDVPKGISARLWRGRWLGQSQKWFAMRFLGTDDDINIATRHPEFKTWRWLPPVEVESGIVAFKRDVYREVFSEFEDLLR